VTRFDGLTSREKLEVVAKVLEISTEGRSDEDLIQLVRAKIDNITQPLSEAGT